MSTYFNNEFLFMNLFRSVTMQAYGIVKKARKFTNNALRADIKEILEWSSRTAENKMRAANIYLICLMEVGGEKCPTKQPRYIL